eukprot:Tbor_TRINITY_DN3674_c0_g1::TRINITY_DN3674_c0_g1_i1::g.390::m.390/K10411/DNAL1; dynein light chain 1, axonemal
MSALGFTSIKEAIARFEEQEYIRRIGEHTQAIIERKDLDEASKQTQIADLKNVIPPVVASQEKYVKLLGMLPPIAKMDKDLISLTACEHLALSTNCIEKIGPGLKELKNLKRLSLGRNAIKKLEQLDIPLLEELWISYNKIDKLSGLDKLKNLKVLFIGNNNISNWGEIDKLSNFCPELIETLFVNNPIYNNLPEQEYRYMVLQRLPRLKKLDGVYVSPEEREEAEKRRTS